MKTMRMNGLRRGGMLVGFCLAAVLCVPDRADAGTVGAPAGGDTWIPGRAGLVQWSGFSNDVDILLSTDGGGTFSTTLAIGVGNDDEDYVRVPDVAGPNNTCVIRVQQGVTTADSAVFTIDAAPAPATIFSDGFESGSVLESDSPPGAWDNWYNSGGADCYVVATTAPVFNGTYSGHEHFDFNGNWVRLGERLDDLDTPLEDGPYAEVSISAYVYVSYVVEDRISIFTIDSGTGNIFTNDKVIVTVEGASDHITIWRRVLGDASPGGDYNRILLADGSTIIEPGGWYFVEMEYKMPSGVGVPDGEVRLWVDGVLDIERTGLDLTDGDGNFAPIEQVALGGYGGLAVGNNYYDDFECRTVPYGTNVPFRLLYPISGESWAVMNQETIRWLPGSGIANVRIEISRDGGTSWTEDIIASTPNTGSYTWTVHDGTQALPQNNCLIRISDVAVPATQDQSHASFSITAQSIGVALPNGGETLLPGRAFEVTWTSTGFSGVDILLSTDGGGTFTTALATDAGDDGSAYVRVPDLGAQVDICRIRVQETGGGTSDDSDGDFTIAALVSTIIFQNGLEEGDFSAWDSTNVTDDCSVSVSGSGHVFSGDYAGVVDWHNTIDTLSYVEFNKHLDDYYGEVFVRCFARVDNLDGEGPYELIHLCTSSDSVLIFALELYPDEGNIFKFYGKRVTGYYTRYPGTSDPAHPFTHGVWHCLVLQYRVSLFGQSDGIIRLWLDGDLVYELTGVDDEYTPGGTPAREASRIGWVGMGGLAYSDHVPWEGVSVIDDVTISNDLRLPGDLTVLSPSKHAAWAVDSLHDITWITGDTIVVPNVHIELSRDGGTSWADVVVSTPNDGSYTWSVAHGGVPVPQDNCVVRVSDAVDGNPIDTSGTFSIVGASLTVTNPGGGEEWGAEGPRTITWTTEGTIAIVDILISRDGGTVWEDIATGVANSGSYIWSVNDGGQMLPQSNCVIRVRDNTDHGLYDDSESFAVAAGSIVVTLPVGGESWEAGIAQEIHWTSNVGAGVSVAIAVSYDGGKHYQTLTGGGGTANDGVSFFGVPDRPTDKARVRVSSGTVSGESPDFTITPQNYNWLFQDGFEAGVPGNWNSVYTSDSSEVNQVSAPVLGGASACESHLLCTDGSTSAYVWKDVDGAGNGLAALCWDGWVRFEALPDTSDGYYSICLFQIRGPNTSGSAQYIWSFYVTGDSPAALLEFFAERNPHSEIGGGWTHDVDDPGHGDILPLATWHRLVGYYKASTVDNAEDGIISFYHDENDGNGLQEIVTATGLNTTSSRADDGIRGVIPPERIYTASAYGSSGPAVDTTIYYDDIGATTNHPGGPFVVVLAPSGGEEWLVGQPADVTWHVTDELLRDITHVDIELSRNNGATWLDVIASNVDVSTLAYDAVTDSYTYTWGPVTDGGLPAVPPQDQCLVRVIDVTPGNPGASDESDSNFSIGEAQVTVLAPNGGGVWGIGTDQDITWTSFGISLVTIYVSWDNGTGWTGVWSTNASDGGYTWPVTGPPSGICLVRIEETGNPTVFDESDAVFSIVNPTLQVTAPNGVEVFNVGDVTNITWNSTGLLNVEIELSRDGNWTNGDGSDVEVIVASTDASAGTYSWTVTGPLSADCLVRISDIDGTPVDESDAVFSIEGLDLTVPVGGETWDAGTTRTITWDAAGVAQVDIELSRDNGSNWETITTNVDATLGTYDWDVTGPGSALCIVRISESTTGSPSDQSDSVFTIAGVEVTAPNGGEFWSLGENVSITWNSGGLTTVIIELSRDGNWVNGDGSDVETLTPSTDATVGSWAWAVTGPSSTTCLIRVSDTDASPSDESDAVFEILAPTITVTSPAAGDAWPVGSSRDITWSFTGITNVKIDVSRDGGTSWEEIIATTSAALGSYAWDPVTGAGSTNCMIRVADTANPWTIYGDSAGFTISEIAVTAPSVGDTWCYEGDDHDITWTSIGVTSNVDIAYSIDGGTSWTDIATNETDDGSYTWTIPDEDSTNCVVRVQETGGGGAAGLSGVFTLTPATIIVTLPIAGGSWGIGTSQTVEWTSPGLANVMIELSRDGNWVNGDGSDVETVVASTDATTGSYTWGSVTGPESANCLVRVSDANDGAPSGVSGTFTIAPASLALVSPDGGEVWSIGKTATVTWDQVGVTAVQIELSTDGDTTWTEIAAAADGQTGSYTWTLNAAASVNCVVRITAGGALTDSSAGTFWIIRPNGDTDGDGFTDQEEVDGGTNPFDKNDRPPVMFHGKTGCGAAPVGGGLLSALLAALAGIAAMRQRT